MRHLCLSVRPIRIVKKTVQILKESFLEELHARNVSFVQIELSESDWKMGLRKTRWSLHRNAAHGWYTLVVTRYWQLLSNEQSSSCIDLTGIRGVKKLSHAGLRQMYVNASRRKIYSVLICGLCTVHTPLVLEPAIQLYYLFI